MSIYSADDIPDHLLAYFTINPEIGLEATLDEYVAQMVVVFREVRRVLRPDGTCWLNLGDSYAGSGRGGQSAEKRSVHWQPVYAKHGFVPDGLKAKDLCMVPARVALALQADGWWLRQDIIWNKPNPMPEPVTDRCVKAHEYVFLLSKSAHYFFDFEAIKEPNSPTSQMGGVYAKTGKYANVGNGHSGLTAAGKVNVWQGRNRRSVWTITPKPYRAAHFATMPPDLAEVCILAGSKTGDTVLDPFNGSGTTGAVAVQNGRRYIGIELNPAYIALSHERIGKVQSSLFSA